jgi:hypothetical protein
MTERLGRGVVERLREGGRMDNTDAWMSARRLDVRQLLADWERLRGLIVGIDELLGLDGGESPMLSDFHAEARAIRKENS